MKREQRVEVRAKILKTAYGKAWIRNNLALRRCRLRHPSGQQR
jgi:hypothetical protein